MTDSKGRIFIDRDGALFRCKKLSFLSLSLIQNKGKPSWRNSRKAMDKFPSSIAHRPCPCLWDYSARKAFLRRVPLEHKAEISRYILDYLRNERLLLPDNFQVWPSKYPFWISKYPPWLSKNPSWLSKYPSWLSKYAYWLSKYPSFKVLFPAVTSPLSSDNVPSFIKRYQSNERICLKLTPLKLKVKFWSFVKYISQSLAIYFWGLQTSVDFEQLLFLKSCRELKTPTFEVIQSLLSYQPSFLGFEFWNNWFAECTDENSLPTFQNSDFEVNSRENLMSGKI